MKIRLNDAYLCGLGFSDYLRSTESGPLAVKLTCEDYSIFKNEIDEEIWEPSLATEDGVFLRSRPGTLTLILDIIHDLESENGKDIFFHFLAGLIQKNGLWYKELGQDCLSISVFHSSLVGRLSLYSPIYFPNNDTHQPEMFYFTGLGLTDVFGDMISIVSNNMVSEDHLVKYYAHVGTFRYDGKIMGFSWSKLHPEAKPPEKHHPSDSGFDLTIIREISRHGNLVVYGTGIGVTTAHGWYFQLVPRSSLAKRGYMLANSVGIIDQGYSGEIMAPLIKIDPEAAPLTLPCRCLQIIPTPVIHFDFPEVQSLSKTVRNSGGFGSTGQ